MSAALKVHPASTVDDWFPDWTGQTCVVVASGPSAKGVNLLLARGRAKFIAVNKSWELCPWTDVLYACDSRWWLHNNGLPQFAGLKISQDRKCSWKWKDIKLVDCWRGSDDKGMVFTRKGLIGWGGNGGFQAVNLAAQFGARKIVLVGFDMRIDKGTHWHGSHPTIVKTKDGSQRVLFNPHAQQVERWRIAMDRAAPTLRERGIAVLNASPVSALTAYTKMAFEKAIVA